MSEECFRVIDIAIRFLTLVGVVVGLFFTVKQLKTNARQKTSEYIVSLQEAFFSDDELIAMYYRIEYSGFVYSDSFHGSSLEKPLDSLLNHLDNIAKIYQLNNVRLSDLGHFAYRYLVVYQSPEIQKYLTMLDGWYQERGLKVKPFYAFREVGKEIEKKYYVENTQLDKLQVIIEDKQSANSKHKLN